jgi:hypothetical protein
MESKCPEKRMQAGLSFMAHMLYDHGENPRTGQEP